jgi:hypothetical protein
MADHDTTNEGGFTRAELDVVCARLSRLSAVDASVLAKLGHEGSARGKKRALVLLLAHQNGGICLISSLRAATEREGLLTGRSASANFILDVRKDSKRGLWDLHLVREGRRTGGHVNLTEKGADLAMRYARLVNDDDTRKRVQETAVAIHKAITIVAKAPRCPFCLDDIIPVEAIVTCGDGDYHSQKGCGSVAHLECLADRRGGPPPCVLLNTQVKCYGRYRKADGTMPTPQELEALKAPAVAEKSTTDACTHCKGRGFTTGGYNQRACEIPSSDHAKLSRADRAHANEPCRFDDAVGIGSTVGGVYGGARKRCHHAHVGGTRPCHCSPEPDEPTEVQDGIALADACEAYKAGSFPQGTLGEPRPKIVLTFPTNTTPAI